jgi:hypothetical protein
MANEPRDVEQMSCEELLAELARLSPERDVLQSQVGSITTPSEGQETQVAAMERQAARMKRIGELIAAKGCGNR